MKLRDILQGVREGDREACRQLAYWCKNIALAYLKYKIKSGEQGLMNLATSLDDLAWDCIADLFERDDENCLDVFVHYFEGRDLDLVKKSELESELRRLVFSAVNDGIFRNYGSHDPSLRKIIRNIKLAANDHSGLRLSTENGTNVLSLGDNRNGDLPALPPEFLEIRLFSRITEKMSIPDILDIVVDILERQVLYRSEMQVVQLAFSIRKVYTRMNEQHRQRKIDQNRHFLNGELRNVLQEIIETKKADLYATYVEKDKINEPLFNIYFRAVEHILHDQFSTDHPEADSYYEHLNRLLPELKKAQYRADHRQYLEYFTKKVRSDLIRTLKKDLEISAIRYR